MSNEGTTEEMVLEPEIGEPETETQTLARRLRNCVDALKELGVDPIALQDDGDDREELLRSARDRGVKLVQHGKGLVEGDSRLRDETLRAVLGGAIDGEKTVVDVARRVARDLKNALDRPGAAVVDDEAVKVKARLSRMLYFASELPPAGPTWGHILAAVEGWRDTLRHLGQMLGVEGAAVDVGFLKRQPARVLFNPLSMLQDNLRTAQRELEALRAGKPQPADNRRPTIDDDDEAVVQAEIIGLKRAGRNTVSVKLKLVWPEDLQDRKSVV